MRHLLVPSLMVLSAMTAFGSLGCAAQTQCMRQLNDLQATSDQQDQEIRNLQGRIAVIRTQQAGTTLSSLAVESWDAAAAGLGWVKSEAPLAYHQGEKTYNSIQTRLSAAQKCYLDHGGEAAHTYEQYKAIAEQCLNSN
jgi:hypothetical protein